MDLNDPLPWDDGRFDTAILSSVLEHVHRPEQLLREVARILSPGGRLVMNVPFFYWIHEAPHDYFRYTEFGLRRLAELAGLRVVELEALGGGRQVLADVLAKSIVRFPLGRLAARFVQWLAARPRWTARGRRRAAKSARRFPLGYFMVAEKPGPAGVAAPATSS